jgi:RNA polymerase sigma-70 factor (ECF subfamily)
MLPSPENVRDTLASHEVRALVDELYRLHSRAVLATLIRLLGDFDLAEDAMHDAFTSALDQWPRDGVPDNPRSWLISAGRFRAIDAIRRAARLTASLPHLVEARDQDDPFELDEQAVKDDQLRLMFTCCHPALPLDARIALTLREVCGLTTEEIARAFLSPPPTIAQRIVRAKAKIKTAGIPYKVPEAEDLPERLDGVLHVIYLVFNEGYSASSGETLTRPDLSAEAIRLGGLMAQLLNDREAEGLLALMLLQESRRTARTSPSGEIVLLEDQDRSLWNREMIAEGLGWLQASMQGGTVGPYTVQAAIAGTHAVAAATSETDWGQIVALYDLLLSQGASPVVELNRAVAVAMRDGIEDGLKLIENILDAGDLEEYHLAHSARAELCRRLGRLDEARKSYERALALTQQHPERRFLQARLALCS